MMLTVLDIVPILTGDCLIADVIEDKAAPALAYHQLFYSNRPIGTREGEYVHPVDCQVSDMALLLNLYGVQTHS